MPRVTLGRISLLTTLGVVLAVYARSGGTMFSTGPLSSKNRGGEPLGGVRSHAEIGGNCSACHAPPVGRQTMADRCLECHKDVLEQLTQERPLHGNLPAGKDCRHCHTEHKGPHAEITSFTGFDHNWTGFALTGNHLAAECRSCHTQQTYHGTATSCYACHSKVDAHKGSYGTNCQTCHNTTAWQDTSFKHRFPIQHGSRRRGTNTCATCHNDESNFKSYTCYNCHEHRPDRIARIHQRRRVANLAECAACHGPGRKRKRERADLWEAEACPHLSLASPQ